MKLVSGKKMGEIDSRAINELGIPGLILMENAGLQVVQFIRHLRPLDKKKEEKIVVLCGKGNNGGDGFVIARHLHRLGYNVETWAMGAISAYKGDAAVNYHLLHQSQVKVLRLAEHDLLKRLAALRSSDLIIDALLGTGARGQVREIYAEAIGAVNASAAEVVAVDIPSGISADSGETMGAAVKAHYTITFALPKRGLLLFPGAGYAGRVAVADIGIPKKLFDCPEIKENLITMHDIRASLAPRLLDGHKGTYGRVLILAGSPGMSGAAVMAGEAALRGGAGLVYIGIAQELFPVLEGKLKEVIALGFPGDGKGNMTVSGIKQIVKQAQTCQALAFGPGLRPDVETLRLCQELINTISIPIVVDAGGLGALALAPDVLQYNKKAPLVLTPHPGEMARLTGYGIARVQQERWQLASEKAAEWGSLVVLKGANTVIALPSGEIFINPTGNHALSTAGTGDLLTGLIASLLAQGLRPEKAAICGVYLHGLAADMLVAESGARGFMAGDILNLFPRALNEITGLFSKKPEDLFWVRPYLGSMK